MATLGGPAIPVSVQTGGQQQGGPAIPVAVVSDGRATQGGPAQPVYVVTSGPVQGGPTLPVAVAATGATVGAGPAIPVYVVSGSGLGGTAPANMVLPAISGTLTIGSLLSTTDGTWTGTAPITYTYQWKRGGVAIGGATANTYTTVAADNGSTITVTVTATNAAGSASATSAGVVPLTFLFRDDFPVDAAAPLATPRTADPGPGAWTIVQADGQMSIVSGELTIPAQATPAIGDLGMYSNADIARTTGVALFALVRFSTLLDFGVHFGLANLSNEFNNKWTRSAFGIEIYDGGGSGLQRVGSTYDTNADQILMIILRTTGAYYIKDEVLLAVGYASNLANVRAKFVGWTSVWKADYMRVAQIASSFTPDTLALYTDATPTAGDTATANQDAVHYIQWTPAANETFDLMFRRVDDNNTMIFRASQAGSTARFYRKIAGVETQLSTSAVTWNVGTQYRIQVRYLDNKMYAQIVNGGIIGGQPTNGYNSEVAGCKVTGFATAANWEIYPSFMTDAVMDILGNTGNPYLTGSGRTAQTISLASGGNITTAISSMRSGDTLSLEAGGSYTFAGGVNGFSGLPSGYWGYDTTVEGNGATITGGAVSLSLTSKRHITISNVRLIDATDRSVLVTSSRWITLDNVYASSNVNVTYLDVFRFVGTRNLTVTDCEAAPSTGVGSHDGFECSDQCGDCTFTDCTAHGLIHGFEVWTGDLVNNVWKNYNITWLNCSSYDNLVGYSSEGGTQAVAQIEVVADGCTAATNSQFDYQGIEGSTLYLEHNTGGTTNGSVVVRS